MLLLRNFKKKRAWLDHKFPSLNNTNLGYCRQIIRKLSFGLKNTQVAETQLCDLMKI